MALGQDIKAATLYRMVMPDHLCPYGLKSKDLLERSASGERRLVRLPHLIDSYAIVMDR